MRKIPFYLTGPMHGVPDYNYPAFQAAATNLRARGFQVVSPHEIPHADGGNPGSISWDNYMRDDLPAMLACQGLILLPGWPTSGGSAVEINLALKLGFIILFLTYDYQLVDMQTGRGVS
jgi:hypothetical protein